MKPTLFLDYDMVLIDFDGAAEKLFGKSPRKAQAEIGVKAFWDTIRSQDEFFLNLPPLPDGKRLYEAVKHLNPTILTGAPPEIPDAARQKRASVALHYPGANVICCRSDLKCLYAKPGDVLVDDYPKYKHLWEEADGIFILHKNAEDSIEQVLRLFRTV
jgi:hypothetical protein